MSHTNEQKLATLTPAFRIKLERMIRAIEPKGYRVSIIEAKRTVAQQREKVRRGYSRTMHSYHLPGADGLGRAADVSALELVPRQAWSARHIRFMLILGSAANWQGVGWGGIFDLTKAQKVKLLTRIRELSAAGWPLPDSRGLPYTEFGLTRLHKYKLGWDPNHVQSYNNWSGL